MRGILKNRSVEISPCPANTNSNPVQVQFNEDNLAQIEAEKPATRMTIDEPKTPFHYANPDDYSDMDEMDLMDSDDAKSQSSRYHRVVIIENDRMASNISNAAVNRRFSEWETSESDDTDHDRKDSEFKIKRKQHYNEYQAVRRLRQIKPNFDEDEDDDDNLSVIVNSEILSHSSNNTDDPAS